MSVNNGSLSLEEQLQQGLISPGTPFPIRQTIEVSFQEDTLEKLQESAKQFKLTESNGGAGTRKLLVTVEGIHTGMTKNRTFYPGNTLEASIPTWTTPHKKPVLKNHNEYSEPLGRIVHADYVESSLIDKYTVRKKLEITDQDAIDKVLDGRYLTLSVGGSANKVVCSVCAKDLVNEGYCGHRRGRQYDGKEAYWTIAQYTGDEISFVNMPADVNAQVISAELVTGKGGEKMKDGQTKESTEEAGEQTGVQTQESAGTDAASLIDNLLDGETASSQPKENSGSTDEGDENKDPAQQKEDVDNSDTDNENKDGEESKQQENADEELAQVKEELEQAKQEIGQLKDAAEKHETDMTSLQAELTEAKDNLEDTKKHLESAEAEKDVLVNQNVALAKFARKSMAERIADLRILQGKDKADQREELIKEWSNSSTKVLESTINDLIESGIRHIEKIASPGLAIGESNAPIVDENGEEVVSTKKQKESKSAPTLKDFEASMKKSIFRTTDN